ncbi:uncharacterized protein PFLUO_LOCUS5262 [Penicillium psychrofluorescens]|uniref:uncharacterized protein n=1 Tax=Penicillium psychrofluorescens TaxID=3158075 RepID=UPI003CCCF765
MAQHPQPPKSRWGVGSFLSQAVAGVESRLDNILMDQEEAAKAEGAKPREAENAVQTPKSPVSSVSRSSSTIQRNDRLQERLARAVVKSNTASGAGSPAASPRPSVDARRSTDIYPMGADGPTSPLIADTPRSSHDSGISSRHSTDVQLADSIAVLDLQTHSPKPSQEFSDLQRSEVLSARGSEDSAQISVLSASDILKKDDQDGAISKLEADHKAAESQWQEETHVYIERIDALQSKLKYLAKEAAESAKNASANAAPGSVDKRMLEKDERIALLLDEGQKLSKTEMDHRTAIKKLRQQLSGNTKAHTETKRKIDKLQRDLISSEARAKRAEAAEKRANESLSSQAKSNKDLEAVTNERNALTETVQDMKSQLSRAIARAEAAEAKAQSDAMEKENRKAADLEEELASVKIEREISQEKTRREVSDLKQQIDQEKDKARMLEAELKGEQSVLESKMESLRSRAEEASSGATGETHAKLLRQIETLQTQYAVASENWQTLEGSLLARLTNVEKERDEMGRREGELRKKIREMNLKSKKTEEDLENSKEAEHDLENKLEERMQELQRIQQRLQKTADDLGAAQNDLVEQKNVWDTTWAQRLEDERAKWREQANSLQQRRGVSPVASSRRSSNLEAAISGLSDSRPTSRRSSTLPPASPEIGTPPRQNSYPASITQATLSPPHINTTNPPSMIMEAPSITFEPDEYFGEGTPATPSAYGGTQAPPARGINELISESTVGAGPSVQLVERMSATVRRLESERAGSKDELTRVTTQRDEARQQVVDLMRELEEKKVSDTHVEELEARLSQVDARYQTTLEMLGEKSEQVEELKADIADLKKIYRELVDSTMK